MLQNNNLIEILNSKKCFKLVCGAGNENLEEIEKLVYLYSKAGCNIFDISANIDAVKAAKKGLKKSGITENRFICVSIGIKGDPHVNKAQINKTLCKKCNLCSQICNQNAICDNNIDAKKCIGCANCLKICPHNAISLKNIPTNLNKVLPQIIEEGVDCIEFHAITDDDNEVKEKWEIYYTRLYEDLL